MNATLKAILIVIVVASALIVGVVAIAAWSGSVNISIGATTGFHVTDETGSSTITSPYSVDVTSIGTHTFTFRIYNDGNVDISVSITETNALPAGTTASWSTSYPVTVLEEGFTTVTLTIEATEPGSGTYTWTFQSAEA